MPKLRTTVRDLEWFLSRLRDKEPFTFSRWGDGEWKSVLGRQAGQNCDGHYYTADLSQDLAKVLKGRPDYALGIQGLAMRLYGGQIVAWLKNHGLEHLEWSNCDVFHHTVIKGHMPKILGALSGREVLLIGPRHLAGIGSVPNVFKPRGHIIVPDKTAHKDKKRIIQDARGTMSLIKNMVVSVCAGMTAEIIVDALHQTHGKDHTIIDFGSLWDPLMGVKSRYYMKSPRLELGI